MRFIVGDHKVRQIKSAISREMLTVFDDAGIGIASATYDIVGFPPVRVQPTDHNETKPAAMK